MYYLLTVHHWMLYPHSCHVTCLFIKLFFFFLPLMTNVVYLCGGFTMHLRVEFTCQKYCKMGFNFCGTIKCQQYKFSGQRGLQGPSLELPLTCLLSNTVMLQLNMYKMMCCNVYGLENVHCFSPQKKKLCRIAAVTEQ